MPRFVLPLLAVVCVATAQVPPSVDWRKEGDVAPVQNQGQCGSASVYAVLSAIETAWAISTGKLVVFPVQQLVDCGGGCNGGMPSQVYTYVRDHGLCADYPSSGQPGQCQKCTPTLPPSWISGVVQVNASVESLMAAVATTSVSVGINAEALETYSGGIFSGPCGSTLDHEMVVVGYGTDAGQDYWILANSWGSSWGEGGYMRLSRKVPANEPSGLCGILSAATYPYHGK